MVDNPEPSRAATISRIQKEKTPDRVRRQRSIDKDDLER